MHYSHEVTVTPENIVTNPVVYPIVLASGIIRRVQVFFPFGTGKLTRCQIYDRGVQILPTNLDGYYALDGDVVNADIYYNMDKKDHHLHVVAWSAGSSYDHTLTVHVDVQGVDEPDVFGVMRLMNETINRLIQLCRELI